MGHTREFIAAVVMWTAATASLVFGSIDSMREGHNAIALGIAIFLAVAACVPTAMAIAHHAVSEHEMTVRDIVEVVDALHEAKRDLHSV